MAGVGFELQKLVHKGTLFSTVKAFIYGSFLAAGPVILTVMNVGIIGWMSYGLFKVGILNLFTVTLVYTFAFSLILTGPSQIVFTRLVADKHFTKKFDDIFPAFITSLVFVSILGLSVSIPFYIILKIFIPVGNLFIYKLFGVLTFLSDCLIWQIMGFISTTKEYQKVIWTYLFGTIFSIFVAYLLIPKITIAGGLAGFCVGQWIIVILLFRITTKHLNCKKLWRKEFFSYFFRYPTIALGGLFINLGFWIDKFIFWAYFKQQQDGSLFYTFNYYDVPSFLAFLTIIPALVYFLILTETNFFKDYSIFVDNLLHQPLSIIEKKKNNMIITLKDGMKGMVKLQGIISLILIVFSEPILIFFGYRGVSIWLFRILILGAFFHVINLNLNIFFLYYEMRTQALLMTITFTFFNGAFTLISIKSGTPYYGLGFLAATAIVAVFSWCYLLYAIEHIDFKIFTSQPLDTVVKIEHKGINDKIRLAFSGLINRIKKRRSFNFK